MHSHVKNSFSSNLGIDTVLKVNIQLVAVTLLSTQRRLDTTH